MIVLQEAGLLNFLRTIFWLLLFYYAIKFIGRWLFPIILKKAANSIKQNMENSQQEPQTKYGETVIDKKPQKERLKEQTTEGEYIDFEEIQ